MRHDLSNEQWDAIEKGQVAAPDGTVYSRRTTRMKRNDAASLVEAGCPLVTNWPGGVPERTRIVWHDGADARAAWQDARPEVTSETPRPPHRGAVATVGRWESIGGNPLLVVTWHH